MKIIGFTDSELDILITNFPSHEEIKEDNMLLASAGVPYTKQEINQLFSLKERLVELRG